MGLAATDIESQPARQARLMGVSLQNPSQKAPQNRTALKQQCSILCPEKAHILGGGRWRGGEEGKINPPSLLH